jgi:hypothetical protein
MFYSSIQTLLYFFARTQKKVPVKPPILSPQSLQSLPSSPKSLPLAPSSLVPPVVTKEPGQGSKKLERLHKTGPELEVTKILIKYGPLTTKEIFRSYQKDLS